jgi:hypothetical protein
MADFELFDMRSRFLVPAGAQCSQSPMTAGGTRGDPQHMVRADAIGEVRLKLFIVQPMDTAHPRRSHQVASYEPACIGESALRRRRARRP